MPTFRPGKRGDTFEERCLCEPLIELCECRGDRNTLIDGVKHCVIWDREYNKYDNGEVGVATSTIEICWPTCRPIDVRKNSTVVRDGKNYTVREQPRDNFDGWTCTTLKYCGNC